MAGYVQDKQQIVARLSRIEGQFLGLRRMVDEDRYCIDVLTQVSAVQSALQSVALVLLRDHTEHCVADAVRSGEGGQKVRELSEAVERLLKR
jgi:DNA-binding FrmR family transcriptional regulator